MLIVKRITQQQQLACLCREQKDQTHHHRQGGSIKFGDGQASEKLALLVFVNLVQRLHQYFHRPPHLQAKLIGYFLLLAGTVLQHRFEGFVFLPPKEAIVA